MHTIDQNDTFPARALINSYKLRLIFTDPKLRPPVLEEMQKDIDRLAMSIAIKRSDPTCPPLNTEDLVAECNYKLAVLITKGRIDTLPNRVEAFKFIKTVFGNHVKSLVSKHRLTLKRGCRKVGDYSTVDRDVSLDDTAATTKNTDISANDPDQHLQLADPASGWVDDSKFITDNAVFFTPIELLVIKEFSAPNDRTHFFAELDTMIGKKPGTGTIAITFSEKNRADGLGLELGQFKKILKSVREKLNWILHMKEATAAEIAWNQAITRLESVFEVQIPASIEKQVVRRLLTMAAVDQYEKVEHDTQVKSDLNFVGAKIPEGRVGTVSCLGVMYQKNSRTCIACGLATACRNECANYGLDSITLDPRLLGSKQYRVPVVVANVFDTDHCILSQRDEEIYAHLKANFNITEGVGEWVYRHKDVGGIAVVVRREPEFEIKLMHPSVKLQDALQKRGNEWFIPADASAEEAINIIKAHAHEVFVAVTQ